MNADALDSWRYKCEGCGASGFIAREDVDFTPECCPACTAAVEFEWLQGHERVLRIVEEP